MTARTPSVVARSLLFGLIASLFAVASVRTQTCPEQTAGAPGSSGKCSSGGGAAAAPANILFPGARAMNDFVHSLTPVSPTTPGVGPGDVLVNPNGSVAQSSGEYSFRTEMVSAGGPVGVISVGALHRSYLATGAGGLDPAGGVTPFGVGWAASFADGPLTNQVPTTGVGVTYVDSRGVQWTTGAPTNHGAVADPFDPAAPQSNPAWTYPAQNGTRWIYMGTTWYRELPNRVLIAYEPIPNAQNSQVGFRPKRIFKHKPGAASALWEVHYVYNSTNTQEIEKIHGTGLLDYEILFTWSTIGTVRRITEVSLNHATISHAWSEEQTVLGYDSSGRLETVRFPKRDIRYQSGGSFDASGDYLKEYDQLGFKFSYDGSNRIVTVKRELLDGTTWASETLYTNVYETSSPTWRIKTQTEDPAGAARVHGFTYPTDAVEWLDPEGIKHKFVATTGQTDPKRIFVDTYTLTPKTGDTSGHGPQTWDLAYSACTCGAISKITHPNGRVVEYDYDTEGRLFVTKTTVKNAAATISRDAQVAYHTWGLPWLATDWAKASRITSVTQEDGQVWTVSFAEGAMTTDVIAPGFSYTWTFKEDALERVIEVLEPTHVVNATSGNTSRKKTEYLWGVTAGSSYGRLEIVKQHLAAGVRQLTFNHDPLGRVSVATDHNGEATTYAYDRAGNVTKITIPQVTSGKDPTKTTSNVCIDVEYGAWDEVTQVKKSWVDDVAVPMTHSKTAYQASYNIFGELITSRTDSAKHDAGASAFAWLTTEHEYDKLGRRKKTTHLHSGSVIEHVIDSFDMIQETKVSDGLGGTPTREFDYDVEGHMTEFRDSTGLKRKYFYEADFSRLQCIEEHGTASQALRKIDITYSSTFYGLPYEATFKMLPSGGSLTNILKRKWNRDGLGRVTSVDITDLLSSTTKTASVAWNGASRLSSRTDMNGRTTTYGYDSAGYMSFSQDPLGNKSSFTRNIRNEITTVQSLLKKHGASDQTYETDFDYDEWGRVVKVTRKGNTGVAGSNAIRKYGYDSLSNLSYFEDAVGKQTTHDFDALGRPRRTKRYQKGGGGTPVDTTMEIIDSPTTADLGTHTSDGFGAVYTDAQLGLIVKRSDHNGNTTTYIYDVMRRLVEKRSPGYQGANLGHSWTYRYDDEGRLDKWKNGNDHIIRQERNDDLKRVTRRWVENPTSGLATISLFTAGEEWDYDAIVNGKITYEARTYAESWITGTSQTTDRRLINETRSFDGFGLMHSEAFGFSHNGNSTTSKVTKTLNHSYGSSVDTGFRHGLTYGSGWDFDFTPDAAAKVSTMDITAPGSSTAFTAAKWFYEGGRTYKREVKLDTTTGSDWFKTTWAIDKQGYLSGITATFGTTNPTTIFDLDQEQNLEGFVTKKKYSTVSGKAGDRFLLDGFDRLKEAKLGVSTAQIDQADFTTITQFDKHVTYALDLAQNRSGTNGKTVTTSSGTTTEEYTVESGSNRYASVGGVFFGYDGNGNLNWDGSKLYIYDYLDRLCEIWVWTAGTGTSTQQMQTTAGPRYKMTEPQIRASTKFVVDQNAARDGKRKDGIRDLNRRVSDIYKKQKNSTSSSSQSSGGPEFLLLSVYGYDTGNRRILRSVALDPEGSRWSTWDGWQQAEEYQDDGGANWPVAKVWFRGRGLTDTLGFAIYDGQNWTRYALIQGTLGKVVAAWTPEGTEKERYEYDPFGLRYGYKPKTGGGYDSIGGVGTEIEQHESAGGGRLDWESGLIYLRNRYHMPALGRFASRDPAGDWVDGHNTGNGYTYAGNAPIALNDPYGLTSGLASAELRGVQWGRQAAAKISNLGGGDEDPAEIYAYPVGRIPISAQQGGKKGRSPCPIVPESCQHADAWSKFLQRIYNRSNARWRLLRKFALYDTHSPSRAYVATASGLGGLTKAVMVGGKAFKEYLGKWLVGKVTKKVTGKDSKSVADAVNIARDLAESDSTVDDLKALLKISKKDLDDARRRFGDERAGATSPAFKKAIAEGKFDKAVEVFAIARKARDWWFAIKRWKGKHKKVCKCKK